MKYRTYLTTASIRGYILPVDMGGSLRTALVCLVGALISACRSGGSSSSAPVPSDRRSRSSPPTYQDTLRRGESLYSALRSKGIRPKYILELSKNLKGLIDLHKIRPGGIYSFSCDSTGEIVRFRYMPDLETELSAERVGGKLFVRRRNLPSERVEVRIAGILNSSLYDAVISAGGTPKLVWELADIFQWDIDFHTEPRKGDRFAFVYEEYRRHGRVVKEGRISAAVYSGEVGEFWAVYFGGGYYDLGGRPLRRMFLRSPLRYRRISSRFTRRRFHPILRRYMPHWGVDYAAPPGTPVHSTADGVVLFVGYKGPNGNMVVLGHRNGYRTYYLHLSRFARGIKRGRRVKQGQVIGYVGATGLATGPHLDYRVRKGRRFLDPLKLRTFRMRPLHGRALESFHGLRDRYVGALRDALKEEMVAHDEDIARSSARGGPDPLVR